MGRRVAPAVAVGFLRGPVVVGGLLLALAAAAGAGACGGKQSSSGITPTGGGPPDAGTADAGPTDGGSNTTSFQFGTAGPWPLTNQVYGAADGLQEMPVVGVSTDESQNLWVATHQALYLLRPGETRFRRYDGSDGLHTQSNPALYCNDWPTPPGTTSCRDSRLSGGALNGTPTYGGAKDPGILSIVGGGPNEVFVGYQGSEPVLDPTTGYDAADPGRHDGKIDRVRLNADGTLTADRFDMLSNDHGRQVWHDRTVERLVYDHFIHKHNLYSGSNHGVTLFVPDSFLYPSASLGFDAAIDVWMGDHLHATVCYHAPDLQPEQAGCSERMGDWRGLAVAPNGDLWHAGKWAAGLIRWDVPNEWIWTPRHATSLNPGQNAMAFASVVFPAPQVGDAVNMTAVAVAKDGTVWFASQSMGSGLDGTGYGVATWKSGQGIAYHDPGALGLPEHDVSDLVALPDGRIVLAGPSTGLSFYDPATNTSKTIRAGQGIPDDHVNRLEVDTMVDPPALHVATGGGAAVIRQFP